MSKRLRLLVLLIVELSRAPLSYSTPDPNSILRDLPFVVPTSAEWQGRLPQFPEETLSFYAEALHTFFDVLRAFEAETLAGTPNVFRWKRESDLQTSRSLKLILTDHPSKFEARLPGTEAPFSAPMIPSPLATYGWLERPSLTRFHIFLVVRMDQVFFDERGKPHEQAFLYTTAALAGQLFGYLPAYLAVPLSEVPVKALLESRLMGARKQALIMERKYLTWLAAKKDFAQMPQSYQIQVREMLRLVDSNPRHVAVNDRTICSDLFRQN